MCITSLVWFRFQDSNESGMSHVYQPVVKFRNIDFNHLEAVKDSSGAEGPGVLSQDSGQTSGGDSGDEEQVLPGPIHIRAVFHRCSCTQD